MTVASISLRAAGIPHGHGLSFKRGISDGLLACREHEGFIHETHSATYERGRKVGLELKRKVAELVKR